MWVKATQSTPGIVDKGKATLRERRKVGRLHSLLEEKPNTQVQGQDAVSMRRGEAEKGLVDRKAQRKLGSGHRKQ